MTWGKFDKSVIFFIWIILFIYYITIFYSAISSLPNPLLQWLGSLGSSLSDTEDTEEEESSDEEVEEGSDEESEEGSESGSGSLAINLKATSCASNISKNVK